MSNCHFYNVVGLEFGESLLVPTDASGFDKKIKLKPGQQLNWKK